MKKFFLFTGLVFVLWGCGEQKVEESLLDEESVEVEEVKKPKKLVYENFDAFFHAITFMDGVGLEEEHREAFYFEVPEGEEKTGIVLFEPKRFYKKHKQTQPRLVEAVELFKKAKLIRGLRPLSKERLPDILKTHNTLIQHPLTFNQQKRSLERKIDVDKGLMRSSVESEDAQTLSYIYDLAGEYDKARRLDNLICAKFRDRCRAKAKIIVSGQIRDDAGDIIEGAVVEVLNYQNEVYETQNGEYAFELKGHVPQKIRLRARAQGYADAFKDFYIVTDAPNQTRDRSFTLAKAHGVVGFDITKPRLANRKQQRRNLRASAINLDIRGGFAETRFENGKFYITTPLTEYELDRRGLVRLSGEVYEGPVTAYVYEFDKESNVNDLLRADATDELSEFFGSMLKTFGMPFIQFYDDGGTELHVDRANPLKITSQIAEMEALRAGSDGVYAPLTDAHMQQLVSDSQSLGGGYPITREYLIENQLVMFPQWWVLDRLKGKWNAEGVKVLDTGGLVETIFYSIDRATGFRPVASGQSAAAQNATADGVQCTRQGIHECEEYAMDDNGCRALPLECVKCQWFARLSDGICVR